MKDTIVTLIVIIIIIYNSIDEALSDDMSKSISNDNLYNYERASINSMRNEGDNKNITKTRSRKMHKMGKTQSTKKFGKNETSHMNSKSMNSFYHKDSNEIQIEGLQSQDKNINNQQSKNIMAIDAGFDGDDDDFNTSNDRD